jgi:hypothetical protein
MIRNLLMSIVCTGAMLFLATTNAQADPFAMSSSLSNTCCTDWTDKAGGAPNPGGGLFAAGRELNQQATVNRTVQQTLATAPFDIVMPTGIISQVATVLIPDHPAPFLKTLSQMNDIRNMPATLSAGGGPGVFTFCPPANGPSVGACMDPISATVPYHGLIRVSQAGTNQYGGSMGFLGFSRGHIYQCTGAGGGADCDTAATQFTNNNFSVPLGVIGGATTSLGIMAIDDTLLTDTVFSNPNYINDPAWPSTPSVIPGFLSFGLTTAVATGHAWTTGMVTVSATQFNAPPFQAMTMTGTDSRITSGPDAGSGSLTLVTTTLYQNLVSGSPTVRGSALTMNLPEPGIALAMGAGVLGLALVGVRRRR